MLPSHSDLVDLFGEDGVRVFADAELPSILSGEAREFLTTVGLPKQNDVAFYLGEPAEVEVDGRTLCFLGLGWYERYSIYLDPSTGEVHVTPDGERSLWRFMNSSVVQLAAFLCQAELLVHAGRSGREEPELAEDLDKAVAIMTAVDPRAVAELTYWGGAILDMELQVHRP